MTVTRPIYLYENNCRRYLDFPEDALLVFKNSYVTIIISIIFALVLSPAMSYKIQMITKSLVLGEGPHWDAASQSLFFVSIHEQLLNKYEFATGEHTQTKLGKISRNSVSSFSRRQIRHFLQAR